MDIISQKPSYDKDKYFEIHHILPKSIWKNYSNLRLYKFNSVKLSVHDHIKAHLYFSLCTNSCWNAIPSISFLDANGSRKIISDEEIKMKALAMEVYRKNYIGSNTYFYGKKHTEESKKKISNAIKNVIWTDERKSEWSKLTKSYGWKRSSEWKENQANNMRNLVWSDQRRKNLSNSLKGRIITDDWKLKISKSCIGNKNNVMTEDRKLEMSISRMGEGNPNYGKIRTDEWKSKHSNISRKTQRKGEIWNELYAELNMLWIKSETTSGHLFSKWLTENTNHKYSGSQLKRLVTSFQEIS